MMKIFYILFLVFILIPKVFGNEELKIITREQWGANENYRYVESEEWQNIFKKWEDNAKIYSKIEYSEEELLKQRINAEKQAEMNNILINEYGKYIEVASVEKYDNGNKLAWKITKVKKINGIVIHHTASDYEDSIDGINKIYKYHAITRQWGDIGYNFLIGNEGEIYEGRAGGDYVVAAHNKWNNMGTVGIAIIGNYSKKPINAKQYESLKKLTSYLVNKYDIDLTEKTYFHEECFGTSCNKPLTTKLMYPITGHRDAGHTSCPGDALYLQIDDIRLELLKEPKFAKIIYEKKIFAKLEKFTDETLINILAKLESALDIEFSSQKTKVKDLLLSYFKSKENKKESIKEEIDDKKIKIKLSYPNTDSITIKSGRASFKITRIGNDIYVKGQKYNMLIVPKRYSNTLLQITSWDRKPTWDKTGKYNDNIFRGDLTVYAKNNELIVVNTLSIEDYLKGLGEVSNFEDDEKIKTIIIAARSYATWYTTKARKFEGEFYDGVDNPNVFQKYLGYGLEERSPNINRLVDETKGKLITYDGELIKPWYFSSSDGNTMSFYEYCRVRYSDEICSVESKKYPYLQSVVDKGSDGLIKRGHGVGISGKGVSYFAEKGWTYDMIIKYFLKGVEVL